MEQFFAGPEIKNYFKVHAVLGSDTSTSKLSPWLSNGCLSIRKLYNEVLNYEKASNVTKSSRMLVASLMWREFYHHIYMICGDKIRQQQR
jgi:deoxyribodipyrimidine photo-lyase